MNTSNIGSELVRVIWYKTGVTKDASGEGSEGGSREPWLNHAAVASRMRLLSTCSVHGIVQRTMSFEHKKIEDVHPGGVGPRHALLANFARGHYQASLVLAEAYASSEAVWVFPSALLLMEQTIELLLKALLTLHDPTLDPKTYRHFLRRMVTDGAAYYDEIKTLQADADAFTLLERIETAYNTVRYGEAWTSIKLSAMMGTYTRLVTLLTDAYVARTGIRLP